MHSKVSDRYLKVLGVPFLRPTKETLQSLVKAQQQNVPYENVSKLIWLGSGRIGIPSYEEFVSHLESHRFGGTCFIQNGYFSRLLTELGFEAYIVASDTEKEKNTHAAIRVKVGDEQFIIDLGLFSTFSGIFPLIPGNVVELDIPSMLYRFTALPEHLSYRIEVFRNGKLSRSHRSNGRPRDLDFFSEVIKSTFLKDAIFMKTIVTHLVFEGGPAALWGKVLYITKGSNIERYEFKNVDEIALAYQKHFNLPKYPIREAIEILQNQNGVNLFHGA